MNNKAYLPPRPTQTTWSWLQMVPQSTDQTSSIPVLRGNWDENFFSFVVCFVSSLIDYWKTLISANARVARDTEDTQHAARVSHVLRTEIRVYSKSTCLRNQQFDTRRESVRKRNIDKTASSFRRHCDKRGTWGSYCAHAHGCFGRNHLREFNPSQSYSRVFFLKFQPLMNSLDESDSLGIVPALSLNVIISCLTFLGLRNQPICNDVCKHQEHTRPFSNYV